MPCSAPAPANSWAMSDLDTLRVGRLRRTLAAVAAAHPFYRARFRELGLAIGLAAIEGDAWREASHGVRTRVDQLSRYLPLRAEIESLWLQPEHRQIDSWLAHADINDVMLATSLCPEGFLVLNSAPAS